MLIDYLFFAYIFDAATIISLTSLTFAAADYLMLLF